MADGLIMKMKVKLTSKRALLMTSNVLTRTTFKVTSREVMMTSLLTWILRHLLAISRARRSGCPDYSS